LSAVKNRINETPVILREGYSIVNDLKVSLRDYEIKSPGEPVAIQSRAKAAVEFGRILEEATVLVANETLRSHIRSINRDMAEYSEPDSEVLFNIQDHANDTILERLDERITKLEKYLGVQ
tara:strand:- start:12576 stop:12938 length:363 start_codon:yes stop_codon:yes gene_type:complete